MYLQKENLHGHLVGLKKEGDEVHLYQPKPLSNQEDKHISFPL